MEVLDEKLFIRSSSGGGQLAASTKGFTLAEVLITLGIIGVVAALTLPAVLSNYRKQVAESRLKKFYTTFNQAVSLAENKYGDVEYWDNADLYTPSGSMDWFNKYLGEFFEGTEGFNDNYTAWIKLSDGSAFGLRFGVQASQTNFDMYFYPNANDIKKCGNETASCTGTKYFTFRFTPQKKLMPYIGYYINDDREQLIARCQEQHNYCTSLIMRDGWKIEKDYPLRF